jgi:succinate-semialdehyde dehydrogenase/glutarate-semialdehyde dehydrogenase/succinyl-CoA reductase
LSQISTVNPSTGEEINTFSAMDKNQVFDLVGKAKRAYPEWKKEYEKRRSYIYNLVEYLKKNKTELATVATSEMGKPLKESIGEIEKCAWALEFYADHGDSFLSDEVLNTDARLNHAMEFSLLASIKICSPMFNGRKCHCDETI